MSVNTIGGYNPLAALNAAKKDSIIRSEARGESTSEEGSRLTYRDVLEWVQNKISVTESYNKILQESCSDNAAMKEQLKDIIFSLLQKYPMPLDVHVIQKFHVRIFDDMAGYGLLTPWLEDPFVEEINVFGPGPNQIEIITNDKRGMFMLDEGFPDAESVLNVAKRMVRKGKMILDQSSPRVDSYIGGGTRVSAMIPPIIRDDKGAVLSIRKQTKSMITTEELIANKTAMPEELEFINFVTANGISGAIIGATGSGKTTLLNYQENMYFENVGLPGRLYLIEESREITLPPDKKVIYAAVYGDEKAGNCITAQDLLKSALRYHPTFICCAEMRGEEAMNAVTAAQTGHVVWSTFHAENCAQSFYRLLTMCKMSGTDLSENLLMQELVDAFPIIISQQQLRDGTRKITGIYEAEYVDGFKVIGHYIYRLIIDHFDYNEEGKVVHVAGAHCRVGDLSDRLAQKIFEQCGLYDKVAKFARKGWQPQKISEACISNGAIMHF